MQLQTGVIILLSYNSYISVSRYVLPVLRIVLFIHTDTDHTDHVVEVFSFYSKARIFGEIRKEEIFVNIHI